MPLTEKDKNIIKKTRVDKSVERPGSPTEPPSCAPPSLGALRSSRVRPSSAGSVRSGAPAPKTTDAPKIFAQSEPPLPPAFDHLPSSYSGLGVPTATVAATPGGTLSQNVGDDGRDDVGGRVTSNAREVTGGDGVEGANLFRVGGAFVVEERRGRRVDGGGYGEGEESLLRRTLMERAVSVEAVAESAGREGKVDHAGGCGGRRRRRRALVLTFGLLAAVAAAGIAAGILVRRQRRDEGGSSHASGVPTIVPPDRVTARYEQIRKALREAAEEAGLRPSSLEELSGDGGGGTPPSTPQRRALAWLANEDGRMVDPNDTRSLVQRYALATFYFATGGSNWTDRCGFLSPLSECNWNIRVRGEVAGLWKEIMEGQNVTTKGVSCSEDNTVSEIMLPLNNLNGTIPEEIGLLRQLFFFSVSNVNYTDYTHGGYLGSKLHGSLPESLSLLPWLMIFSVENHALTGTIPASFFAGAVFLTILSANYNQLSGTLPSLSNLSRLSYAEFDSNLLTGELPSLGRLSNLEYLSVWDNGLTGSIPSDINNLGALQVLYLDLNSLSSTIPFAYGSFPELVILSASSNHLSGTIPTSIFHYSKLMILGLGDNLLTGSLPEEVGNLSDLIALDVAGNSLTSTIPSTIANMKNLERLVLSINYFSGTLPHLAGLEKLSELLIYNNVVGGRITQSMGNLSGLETIALTWNVLTGTVPLSFAELTNLDNLFIDGNKLTGSIDFLCDVVPLVYADCLGPDPYISCNCCARCCKDYKCYPPRQNENLDDVHALQGN